MDEASSQAVWCESTNIVATPIQRDFILFMAQCAIQ
jgi:hypothetical protein